MVHTADEAEDVVVAGPHDEDAQERHHERHVGGPLFEQRATKLRRARRLLVGGYGQGEDEQRDGDGEDAVAERLDAARLAQEPGRRALRRDISHLELGEVAGSVQIVRRVVVDMGAVAHDIRVADARRSLAGRRRHGLSGRTTLARFCGQGHISTRSCRYTGGWEGPQLQHSDWLTGWVPDEVREQIRRLVEVLGYLPHLQPLGADWADVMPGWEKRVRGWDEGGVEEPRTVASLRWRMSRRPCPRTDRTGRRSAWSRRWKRSRAAAGCASMPRSATSACACSARRASASWSEERLGEGGNGGGAGG